MWKLRIGAEAGQDPYLFSTNNYISGGKFGSSMLTQALQRN
uniref:Uncharacterized protein n=1 Tax=Brassica oleracea TaxID=3712 RepID=A0A3P6CQS5_BRAOL|nr:unnamed protein product [Brassica oleracea]